MKVVIPVDENLGIYSKVSEHFGRAPFFIIFEKGDTGSSNTLTIIPNRSQHTNEYEIPAQNILALNPDIVISTGMERRTITFFQQAGVRVLQCPSGTVEYILALFKETKLLELSQGRVNARPGY